MSRNQPPKASATLADASAALDGNLQKPRDPLEPATEADAGPLVPAGAAPTLPDQMDALLKQVQALTSIMGGTVSALTGLAQANVPKPTDEELMAVATAQPMPMAKPLPRVKIMLEDNDNIPPGGQFMSVDGVAYILQPNVEADVPINLLDVLDNATMSVPIVDGDMNVIGYRDRLRFPYRTIRDRSTMYETED